MLLNFYLLNYLLRTVNNMYALFVCFFYEPYMGNYYKFMEKYEYVLVYRKLVFPKRVIDRKIRE